MLLYSHLCIVYVYGIHLKCTGNGGQSVCVCVIIFVCVFVCVFKPEESSCFGLIQMYVYLCMKCVNWVHWEWMSVCVCVWPCVSVITALIALALSLGSGFANPEIVLRFVFYLCFV